jgi:hypothetical protein
VKTFVSALTALLLASAMHMQPVHAELRTQRVPGLSVQNWPEVALPAQSPSEERLEERLREQLYGSGSEEWLEERVREERRARGHCYRMAKPTEREECLDDVR